VLLPPEQRAPPRPPPHAGPCKGCLGCTCTASQGSTLPPPGETLTQPLHPLQVTPASREGGAPPTPPSAWATTTCRPTTGNTCSAALCWPRHKGNPTAAPAHVHTDVHTHEPELSCALPHTGVAVPAHIRACTALYCTALYCTVRRLYCTAQCVSKLPASRYVHPLACNCAVLPTRGVVCYLTHCTHTCMSLGSVLYTPPAETRLFSATPTTAARMSCPVHAALHRVLHCSTQPPAHCGT
jgi:hypothetical protein